MRLPLLVWLLVPNKTSDEFLGNVCPGLFKCPCLDHSHRFWFWRSGHGYFQNAPQVILMCSLGWASTSWTHQYWVAWISRLSYNVLYHTWYLKCLKNLFEFISHTDIMTIFLVTTRILITLLCFLLKWSCSNFLSQSSWIRSVTPSPVSLQMSPVSTCVMWMYYSQSYLLSSSIQLCKPTVLRKGRLLGTNRLSQFEIFWLKDKLVLNF